MLPRARRHRLSLQATREFRSKGLRSGIWDLGFRQGASG